VIDDVAQPARAEAQEKLAADLDRALELFVRWLIQVSQVRSR
jgi:hypothetical protein